MLSTELLHVENQIKVCGFEDVMKEEIEKVENKPINFSSSLRSGGMSNAFHCYLC